MSKVSATDAAIYLDMIIQLIRLAKSNGVTITPGNIDEKINELDAEIDADNEKLGVE